MKGVETRKYRSTFAFNSTPIPTCFCLLTHHERFLHQNFQVGLHYPNVPPEPTSHRGNVLIVDDDAGVRDVCTIMLKALGYDAKSASSGERALETLETKASDDIEVVLLDLEMPRMK